MLPNELSFLASISPAARRRSNILRIFSSPLAPILIITSFLGAPAPLRADDPDNCLLCHQFRGLTRFDPESSSGHVFFVNPDYAHNGLGPHSRLACTDCHQRAEVATIPHQPVTPVNCSRQCHLADPTGAPRSFSHESVADMLTDSAHAPNALDKLQFTDGPLLNESQSACLYCHDEPIFRNPGLVLPSFSEPATKLFDRCEVCHSQTIPTDINYFIRHIASRLQPARSSLELAQVCAVCHSDPRVIEPAGLPDAVASYVRSFHGKAALLGDQSTANCLSCHVAAGENAHLMLGKDDPRSSVFVSHVADSCRSTQCHPGADPDIADTAVHLDLPSAHGTFEFALAVLFIILTILTFGPSALLVLLDLIHVLLGRHHHADEKGKRLVHRILKSPHGRHQLKRFSGSQRIQHWILTILFIALVLTGFPLKFADRAWSAWLIQSFGGLHVARTIHHWAGIALVLGFMIHLVDIFISYLRRIRELEPTTGRTAWKQAWLSLPMWISPTDVRKSFQLFAYLLFLRKDRPAFGRFSPTEKFEYLGVFWGTILLGITGLLLWGVQFSSHFLSGRAFNILTIAHTYEAFLAVIHVGILHIYNVILAPKVFPLSTATLNGHTPIDKLVEEHGELIEDVARRLGISEERGDPSDA